MSLKQNAETSTLVPLLIAPRNELLRIGGSVNFNNQVWEIEDGDIFSLTGIGYYYLKRGNNSRDEEDLEENYDIESLNNYYIGSEIKLNTENGFYNANLKIKLKSRTMNSVIILPLEAGNLEIITFKEGTPVTNKFVIKENV